MPYRFARDVCVQANLRAVLGGQVDRALRRASAAPRTDVHHDVHEIRKALKKVRAALRIVRGSSPTFTLDNMRFRDIGRRLSDTRDAAAVVESVDSLRTTLAVDLGEDGVDTLRDSLLENRDRMVVPAHYEPLLKLVASELRDAAQHVTELTLDRDGFSAMAQGISLTYRRGRELHAAADIAHHPEHFHEWRKRAKYHRYHLELLLGQDDPLTALAHKLTNYLGEAQDVAVVLEMVEGAEVRRSLIDARVQMWTEAIELGSEVYAAEPPDLVDELRGKWAA